MNTKVKFNRNNCSINEVLIHAYFFTFIYTRKCDLLCASVSCYSEVIVDKPERNGRRAFPDSP